MTTYRIVIGVAQPSQAAEVRALLAESGDCAVVGAATSSDEVVAVLASQEVDAVLLHEGIGPIPVLDLARQLSSRFPDVGVVLLARDQSAELLRSALQTGVRGVATLPLSLEDVQSTVVAAAGWARSVRARLLDEEGELDAATRGQMVVVAGGKGGVGATTLAVRLALQAQAEGQQRVVCLVDLDLQGGDVRGLLDITHRRSLGDLIEVASDLTSRQLEESLYVHTSGLRVLLPPRYGEQAEDVNDAVARNVLGAIRSRFDVVVVDAGTTVTDASAVAVEMASQVLVVTTPDVLALRSVNRLIELWDRLGIRKDGIGVLVNRASKESEVQPDLVGRVVEVPVLETTVPADFRSLEASANTGIPERVGDGHVPRAVRSLAAELTLIGEPVARAGRRRRAASSEAGQVATEAMGMVFIIGVVVMLLWQAVLTGYTYVLAGNAAREGARQLAVGEPVAEAVEEDLPDAWARSMEHTAGTDQVEVTLAVPALMPSAPTDWRVTVSAGTVIEDELVEGG